MGLLRGWLGEKITAIHLWLHLNNKIYKRFHNVIIPSWNGTSQIDHLAISKYGIFIVETKNLKGWIFGSMDQAKWTQTLPRRKYSFQNPLRQTYRQKKVLAEFLNVKESAIFTMVFFVGDCQFMTPLPSNVMNIGLRRYIKNFKNPILSIEDVNHFSNVLKILKSESTLTKKDHIKSLHHRHTSTTTYPRCGGNLILRTTRKGPNIGSKFWRCDNYPRCRFSRTI